MAVEVGVNTAPVAPAAETVTGKRARSISQGVALVPGLYMFRSAFVQNLAGKACAIGLILFAFILILTGINNRYVRVEK